MQFDAPRVIPRAACGGSRSRRTSAEEEAKAARGRRNSSGERIDTRYAAKKSGASRLSAPAPESPVVAVLWIARSAATFSSRSLQCARALRSRSRTIFIESAIGERGRRTDLSIQSHWDRESAKLLQGADCAADVTYSTRVKPVRLAGLPTLEAQYVNTHRHRNDKPKRSFPELAVW